MFILFCNDNIIYHLIKFVGSIKMFFKIFQLLIFNKNIIELDSPISYIKLFWAWFTQVDHGKSMYMQCHSVKNAQFSVGVISHRDNLIFALPTLRE